MFTRTRWKTFEPVKRQLHGTYISVEPFHLFRYLDEQSFRYNGRKLTDAEHRHRLRSGCRTPHMGSTYREGQVGEGAKRQGRGKRKR